jgi:hypothetical protein
MTIYRERLLPGPWTFLATALVIPASLLVFLPINTTIGVVVAIVLYIACVFALVLGSPVIEVTDSSFIAGRARIPIENIGATSGYIRSDATDQRGPQLDARAWLVIRGWVDPVVKVEVVDERDPAPYWLVSTRRPAAVISALAQARNHR